MTHLLLSAPVFRCAPRRANLARWVVLVLHALFLAPATAAPAVAAPAERVRDGLWLELDAAAQRVLRERAGLPGLANGVPMDRWLDGSGAGRTLVQPSRTSRPLYRSDGAEALLRFDGKDDILGWSGPARRAPALTVVLLAAPTSNPGAFSGFFACAQAGRNDYTSGLNLDQGPVATGDFSVLNVESAGSGGFRNLLDPVTGGAPPRRFGGFHVFTVRTTSAEEGNELFVDGRRVGARRRLPSDIGLDEFVVGGRIYSNDGGELPFAQGSFHGDIAAVLVYDRRLSDDERAKVEERLLARVPALNALAGGLQGHALETLKDAPVVQMFVPGFTVDELPAQLRNLTGVRYRHDGKLVALGYDGRIHLVTDTDGDGREDRATAFWDRSTLRGPIGMELLPAGDPRGDGVLVASKGKVSLILDRDRDGVADEEIIVATGWKEITQSVDAVGLAVDPRDGSIYFGLGTANYANGYLIDPGTGKSAFDLGSERGTIQRVSADFKTRETICTGVRFTCALAFHPNGDLFASEQEGATWLPNGNPLDELLHIQRGRHYGFPPRHPRHLPQVIDEPAVFEYGPQHQSTVGMIFNLGVNGGPSWGPPAWAGDALLCGESRGKLYRTRVVKTPAGYVAQNQLIGGLGMLLVDACVTPRGDLLLACHSGLPDWGTGPAGAGKVFRVRWTGRETPQPVLAWAAAPDEFRVAFDRPLQDADWAGARSKVRIEAGRHVAAGDRFETIRPGYQVVRDQLAAPRRWVEVNGLTLTADRRTLVLRVPRQTEAVSYAITLPTPASWRTAATGPGVIEQMPEMDLAVTLDGVRASLWPGLGSNPNAGAPSGLPVAESIWPHPSPAVTRALTRGSAEHEHFFQAWAAAGDGPVVRLRGQIDRSNLFVPAVQPGATLDWDPSKDDFARQSMTVHEGAGSVGPGGAGAPVTLTGTDPVAGYDVAIRGPLTEASAAAAGLTLALGDRVRPVPLNRLALPWARRGASPPSAPGGAEVARSDVRGRWLEGRRVFFGDGGCATCHALRGEGTAFGPDLSNLIHRDRDSVLKDITRPSATINPDVTGSTVVFRDGTEVNGVVATLDERRIVVRQPAGVQTERPRSEVASIRPMTGSLMPENLEQVLTPAQMEDLLTFLLVNPLEPTRITRTEPEMPPARTRKELEGLLPSPGAPAAAPGSRAPLRILLCIDDKDHGIDEHDYPLWQERWAKLLALGDGVTVTTARVFPSRAQLAAADVMVFYSRNSGWGTDKAALLDEFQGRGGGLVLIHWAMEGRQEALAYGERVGLATGPGSRYRHGAMELNFVRRDHPITRGFTQLPLIDETYWVFHGDPSRVTPLAEAVEENAPRVQLWTHERGKGRVFGSIPGHYMWTFDDPLYRVLLLRGIAWAARQDDVDRLLDLATIGARVAP